MIIKNVIVYTEDKKFTAGGIVIHDDKIDNIYTTENVPDMIGEEVIDGRGAYAIPGLIDLHFHGCMGDDFCDNSKEAIENIAKYEDILEHRSSMAKVIIKELTAFKKAYGKERKTVIDNLKEAVVAAKKIEEQDVVFLMDRFGYAKIVDTSVYERNKEAANAEYRHIFTCKNTDKICIFTDKGQMHLLKVLDLPYGKFRDKGTPIDNLCNYDSKEENVVYLAGLEHVSSHRMLFGTKYAMIKVVDGMEFVVAKKTTAATKLGEEDEVLTVCPLEENDTLVMATKKDMFLRIDCAQIPQKKKGAVGVRGMKLAAGDELKSIHVLHEGEEKEVEVKGKPVALHRLHVGNRDTKGVKK